MQEKEGAWLHKAWSWKSVYKINVSQRVMHSIEESLKKHHKNQKQ